tara:strand:+ start:394 stop:1518 length:1125 start_codon:yes stop_codon:yes gene_type:complete
MLKYIKYYFPISLVFLFIFSILNGENYPTYFAILFSLSFILGDYLIPRDSKIQSFIAPKLLDLSIYLALPSLFMLIFLSVSIFSNNNPMWYSFLINNLTGSNFVDLKNSFHYIDKFAIIFMTVIIGGSMGITAGHEMAHRKKNKLDKFIGNWLLALSFDCNFAIEHVYGHHKNVCLAEDPASAKRGENIYLFIFKAIYNEHVLGWKYEMKRLKIKNLGFFNFQNRIIIGYTRSIFLYFIFLYFFGFLGSFIFLLIAFLSKVALESINYIEHYGLIRVKGKPVRMRHSWNSNHFLSSIYLFNVTRHSDHHRNSSLKFWELSPYDKDAPLLPYGYLTMLYLVLFLPFLYKKIMKKELENWDENYASELERELIKNY